MNDKLYTIQETCALLKIPAHTMRRLCNSGLIPYVKRDRLGHRVFTEDQLNHARVILGLRQAGLKKAGLKHYTNLVRQGDSTLAERKALLETEKRQAWQRHDSIQHDIDFMERQIELIDQELAKPEHKVNPGPLCFVRSGGIFVANGHLRATGANGIYWSRSCTTLTTAYYSHFTAAATFPSSGPNARYYGFSLRCLQE